MQYRKETESVVNSWLLHIFFKPSDPRLGTFCPLSFSSTSLADREAARPLLVACAQSSPVAAVPASGDGESGVAPC